MIPARAMPSRRPRAWRGRVEISRRGRTIEAEVAYSSGARRTRSADDLDTVASEDKNQAAGLAGQLARGLRSLRAGDDFRDIAGTLVIVVIGERDAARNRRSR